MARVATFGLLVISSGVVHSAVAFLAWRSEFFLPILQRPTSIWVDAMNLLVCCIKSWCTLFTFAVLEWSWTFVLICCFSLLAQFTKVQYLCSLNFQNSLYNSSSIFGCSVTRWLCNWPTHGALMACVIACSSETSEAWLLAEGTCRRNLAIFFFYIAGRRKKSSSVLMFAWKP
jgi:hypothetical protein